MKKTATTVGLLSIFLTFSALGNEEVQKALIKCEFIENPNHEMKGPQIAWEGGLGGFLLYGVRGSAEHGSVQAKAWIINKASEHPEMVLRNGNDFQAQIEITENKISNDGVLLEKNLQKSLISFGLPITKPVSSSLKIADKTFAVVCYPQNAQ